MSRTTIATIIGLLALGCVVAWLPAQESSRRTAAKYRPAPSGSITEGIPPDGMLAPVVTPSGRPSTSGESQSRISAGLRSQYPAPGPLPTGDDGQPLEQLPAGDAGSGSELDDSQLHSVLKRGRPGAPAELPSPLGATSLKPDSASGSSELPRRGSPSLPPTTSGPPAPQTRSAISADSAIPRSIQNLMIGGKSAALKVDVTGPQGVTVGKPAPYVINVSNESDASADDVQVRMVLPTWVAIQGAQPTSGEAAVQGDPQGMARLVWNLQRVPARGRETLKLQLVTGQGDTFDLAVEWACKPAVARTAIVVRQPQLALSLAGPADMTFGEEKSFILSVSNPGTGDAEHVMVSVAAGNSPPQQFDAQMIPAGHKKEVPLAVVASQPGAIELQISAVAESGLEARTTAKINVRKADVSLAIEGPPLKYAGSEATYLVSVTNGGSAAADNINLSLALPNGAKYLGGIDGAATTASGLKWKIASLAPGGERTYEVRLLLSTAGLNRVAVQSQATASGTANCAAETEVEAVSDLKLVVNDPSGPLPTGEQAIYELQVMNRGSQAARQVKIVIQFSDGVEPVSFEGCEARIVPGQVLCQPLAQLGPGEQATLRVKAKAQQAGTHHFRVEVTTTDGDARLVSEGTTRFFSETGRGGAAATTARKASQFAPPSIPTTVR
jgi:Domain of unknown function DUF11